MTKTIKLKELPTHLHGVVRIKDPDGFIDLLAANSYFAGNMDSKMPVDDTRRAFEYWLNNYTKRTIRNLKETP